MSADSGRTVTLQMISLLPSPVPIVTEGNEMRQGATFPERMVSVCQFRIFDKTHYGNKISQKQFMSMSTWTQKSTQDSRIRTAKESYHLNQSFLLVRCVCGSEPGTEPTATPWSHLEWEGNAKYFLQSPWSKFTHLLPDP